MEIIVLVSLSISIGAVIYLMSPLLGQKASAIPRNNNKSAVTKFYQIDKKQVEEAYNTIDDSQYFNEINIGTDEVIGQIKLPSGSNLNFKKQKYFKREIKPATTIEKLDIYVEYLIEKKNIKLDLEQLLTDNNSVNSVKKFDDFLEQSTHYGHIRIDNNQIDAQRKEIISLTLSQMFDDDLIKCRFNCLINDCEFTIIRGISDRISYELTTDHPMSEYSKNKIVIRILPLNTTIEEKGLAHFERNLGKTTTFTVFGTAKKVFSAADKENFEIQIDPLSIS